MNIALVGYGKMGHLLKTVAVERHHRVAVTIDVTAPDADVRIESGDAAALRNAVASSGADGVIEFSHPAGVVSNIRALVPLQVPIVVGTTGWHDAEREVTQLVEDAGAALVRASNFSIGVFAFYKIVAAAAAIMSRYDDYDVAVWETHHNQKADSPSGTALEIARCIMEHDVRKTAVVIDAFHEQPKPGDLHVSSTRVGKVPGTHTVFFDGSADTIELTHRARNREGLARGAVTALERLAAGLLDGTLKGGRVYGLDDIF
ncbi:MAG: 4-hydroxy-tetrahydrodipicolinate reductase [Treponema sp.]|nr:4-hydroxy-tetrahydrodipicolinate reductase [Treponema sp.]